MAADDTTPAYGTPDDGAVPTPPPPAGLKERIEALRAVVAELPSLGEDIVRTGSELAAARLARDEAAEAAAAAASAARAARLPRPRAWVNLLTGRHRERRDAAAAALVRARAVVDEAEEAVQRLAAAAARLASRRDAARAARSELGPLLEASRLGELLAANDPRAAQVVEIDRRLAAVGGRLREVAEAAEAVAAAAAAVEATLDRLSSAHAWGTYDTFFGGGLVSSLVKHDRIAEANAVAGRIPAALARARVELADVRLDLGPTSLDVDPLSRGLDVWFDNLFSDWAVQAAIKDQQAAVQQIGAGLHQVAVRLGHLRRGLVAQQDDALAVRRRLLAPGD